MITVDGTFTRGGWTWGIENTTPYVIKGMTPIVDASWARVKAGFAEPR